MDILSSILDTYRVLTSGVISEFRSDDSLINSEILKNINNPVDRKKLEEAVDYLQKNKTVKERDVDFSDRRITISIG